MKKLLLIAAVSSLAFACNDASKSSTTTTDTATVTPTAPVVADTTSAAVTPVLKDGLMTLKDGKVQIMKAGAWVALEAPVTCTNGRKVSVTGEVTKGDKKRKLEDGMMIDQDGQILDKNGKLMDTSGWD